MAQVRPDVAAQREAMQKLAFLVGQWKGEATVSMGPGGPRRLEQTEDVQFKLDGLVLLIEGTGRNPVSGAVEFNALATVSFDEASGAYRFRAYSAATTWRPRSRCMTVASSGASPRELRL